ncbi:MAG: glycosyltransferase family 2 protein [Bacteroidetes bacterium]|nr:glycosyltransferase family 2 protein [Bacteroidota bacterium]
MKPRISVVSPVYKAEKILPELVKRINAAVSKITDSFEIILVEDGGPDNSWQVLQQLCTVHKHIKAIKLSRNFGQHYAITAGIDHAKGDWVVVMDCDLQDQPEEIEKLYSEALKGYDLVFARRANRRDTFFKKFTSRMFYKMFSYLSGMEQDGSISNFGIYSSKAIKAVNSMREPMRAFSPMIRWVGFSKTAVDVEHASRYEGTSSYNWSRLIELAIDISLAYSDKPLRLTVKLGFMMAFLAAACSIVMVILYFAGQVKETGYTSLIFSIWFLSGLIIFTLGILGLYVGKIFDGIKGRPLYFIDTIINEHNGVD